jgi:hypothetical protein
MVLSAVDATGPADVKTVNQDVAAHSDLTFITAKAPEEYPFYCAVVSQNPSSCLFSFRRI